MADGPDENQVAVECGNAHCDGRAACELSDGSKR
jgi:hypothetical protein